MEYFLLSQDKRYLHAPVIENIYQNVRRKDFTVELAHRIPERNVVYCNSDRKQEFIDILDQQIYLVSREIKKVFQMYQKEITYKFFCCLNNITGDYKDYYAPIIPYIDCAVRPASGQNRFDLKVEERKIGDSSIFRIEFENRDLIVVRLDVAESLLRRRLKGIELKRASVV